MRAGRRSTISSSAPCSTPAARPRSRRPNASAGASSTSGSAPVSLTDYAPRSRVVGVDYCEPMLRKAHERVAEHALAHVEALAVMDAQQLAFPDATFDAVVAQYVITTVPDPEAALDEIARVTKPGGEIILVNHLGAEMGLRRAIEQGFAPLARRLGWRPEFRWQRLAQWAAGHDG